MKFTKQQLDNIILEEMSRVILERENRPASLLTLLGSIADPQEILDIIQNASDSALFGAQTAKGEEGWQDPVIAGMISAGVGRYLKVGPNGIEPTGLGSYIFQQVQKEREFRTEQPNFVGPRAPTEIEQSDEVETSAIPSPPKVSRRVEPSREDIIAAAGDLGTKPEGEIAPFADDPAGEAPSGAEPGADTGDLARGDYTLADFETDFKPDTTAADEPPDESEKTIRESFKRFLK
tara:strand:+ start:2450 stop:3154 length:705 start_codon:yes stop_codon:yes gene_type:complete